VSKEVKVKTDKKKPSWSEIKKALATSDRTALIGLISDMYALSSQNKAFLHARFSTGTDALKPYLKIIDEALYPDILRNKPVKIAKAKKAINDYKKASGDPKGILELMVFFVETGTEFTVNFGDIDEDFYLSLERMFGQALDLLLSMDKETKEEYSERFAAIVVRASNIGWGYHDALDDLFHKAFPEEKVKTGTNRKVVELPKFTSDAKRRWDQIPEGFRAEILERVFCVNCGGGTPLQLREGKMVGTSLLLRGHCKKCGGDATRVVEPG